MEQAQRKRTPQDRTEAEAEQAEVDTDDREAKLAEIDEVLDSIEDVLEEAEEFELPPLPPLDPDPEADLHAIGLYGPSDLDEHIAQELAEIAKQEAIELEVESQAEEHACMICGACPVRPGCPYTDGNGDVQYAPFPDGEDPFPF